MQLLLVIPELFKEAEKITSIFKALRFLYRIIGIVATLTAEIDSSKTIDGHIGTFVNRHESHHLFLCDIRFENRLAPDPVCALFRNCFLRQLITKLYLKFCPVQTALSGNPGNIKFTLRLWRFFGYKRW